MNRPRIIWLLPLCFASISVLYGHGHGAEIGKLEDVKNNQEAGQAVVRVPKQVGSGAGATVQNGKDHEKSAGHHFDHHGGGGGFGHHGHGHGLGVGGHGGHYGDGKYFQYAHNPSYDEYEFGYRRGNDYHFQERYEKRGPYGWNFKTKVKWGDKYAGYGEQYYDYNHADKSYGHDGGHDGGHGHGHHGHDEGHYSEQVPTVAKITNKRQSKVEGGQDQQQKQQQQQQPQQIPSPNTNLNIEKMKGEESQIQMGLPVFGQLRPRENRRTLQQHQQQQQRQQRNPEQDQQRQRQRPQGSQPILSLNPVNGRVTDESTGRTYILKPAN